MAKIALLRFRSPETRREYTDRLRERLYAAGFEPHQVTDTFRKTFSNKSLAASISGTADAERACDVAAEVRGVHCRLIDDGLGGRRKRR